LNLTQTGNLAPGYSSDVYLITGTVSSYTFTIQRKSDGTLYPAFQNANASVVNAAINATLAAHNLQFDLGNPNFHFTGVAPAYASMFGDITITVNMTTLFGTADGVITLTGQFDGGRQ
jgi:hypothetical protein